MRYCVLDLETTGLDINRDRIIEIGYAIYDSSEKCPLVMRSHFILQDKPLNEEIKRITGIKDAMINEFGVSLAVALNELVVLIESCGVVAFAGHNALSFDKPFLKNEMSRVGLTLKELPWLDTKIDLPLDYAPKSTSLGYMAADHGFLNPFAHRALFDVLTCGVLISMYSIDKLADTIKSPLIEIRAVVTYDDRSKAQKRGYYWDPARKYWCKQMRECNFERERQEADFQVVVIT